MDIDWGCQMFLIFCDSEFNGFGGELISMALVPENTNFPSLYFTLPCPNPTPWVAANVIPHLNTTPIDRFEAQTRVKIFLNSISDPHIIADWPEDIIHFWQMLLVGQGKMMAAPDITTTLLHLPGFNASEQSRIPHNALADAEALRDFYQDIKQ